MVATWVTIGNDVQNNEQTFLSIATLTIIHLRVSSLGATEAEVQGVVALNLRDQTSHRFSCGSTEGMPQDLVWERADGMAQEFPTMIQGEALMLDLEPPPEEDLGLICRNILTGENKFINVTRGKESNRLMCICERLSQLRRWYSLQHLIQYLSYISTGMQTIHSLHYCNGIHTNHMYLYT